MMLKKRARRSAISLVIVCLTLAVVCLWGPEAANTTTFFSSTQRWNVNSSGFSLIAVYNFNTGQWSLTEWVFGNAAFTYNFPLGTNRSFYLFDHDAQRWSEGIYLEDFPL